MAKNEPTYKPIEPKDEDANPVLVAVPKNDEEVAKEGNALAEAESVVSGGVAPPFGEPNTTEKVRVWSLDADHNTNARQGRHAWDTRPDLVEER